MANGFVDDIKKSLGFGGVARRKTIDDAVDDAEAGRVRDLKKKQDDAIGIDRNDD